MARLGPDARTALFACGLLGDIAWRRPDSLFVWLSAREVQITSETVLSLFWIMWGLAFVPSLVAELLNAHLGAELRSDNDRQ